MKPAPQPTKALLKLFDDLHVARLGERAVIHGGKDAKLLHRLCVSHGPERVKELMELFFTTPDEFIARAGFTVGVFVSQCGKLIARQKYRVRAPILKATLEWRDECAALHQGRCTNIHFHTAKMAERSGEAEPT